MEPTDVRRALTRIAHEVVERNRGTEDLVIVGIRTRGAFLADRLATSISSFEGSELPSGALDVSLYRDDVALRGPRNLESTTVPRDLDGRVVVLVFTEPDEHTIRIISLRKALRHERERFGACLEDQLGTG